MWGSGGGPGPGAEEAGRRGELAGGRRGRGTPGAGQRRGVENREGRPGSAAVAARRREETDVEGRVMRRQHAAAGEGEESRKYGADRRRPADHCVGDAGEGGDVFRNWVPGIDESGEL